MIEFNNELFEKSFRDMTKGIEDHEFKHFNHSMNCMVYSKEHYKLLMKQRGMVPTDMMEHMAEQWDKKNPEKKYELEDSTLEVIQAAKGMADRKGNLRLSGRLIDELVKRGLIKPPSEHAPKQFQEQGGFL